MDTYVGPSVTEDFMKMDAYDESLIMKGISLENLDEYVYTFQEHGDTIVGLTVTGVMSLCQIRGGITSEMIEFQNDSKNMIAIFAATDEYTKVTVHGGAEVKCNEPFAVAKLISKAERNAIKKLLPIGLVKTVVKTYFEDKEKIEKEVLLSSIKDRFQHLNLSRDKLDNYLSSKDQQLKTMTSKQLRKVQSFIVTKNGQDFFKGE